MTMQQAAADAWAAVFDSTVAFDDKARDLEDAARLQATVRVVRDRRVGDGGHLPRYRPTS